VESLEGVRHGLAVATSLGREDPEVRRPAEQDVLPDRDAVGDRRQLRAARYDWQPLATTELGERPSPEPDLAAARNDPGDRVDQRRLPGAVRADHAGPRSGRDGQRDVADDLASAELARDPGRLERELALEPRQLAFRLHAVLPLRRSTTMKNGAPMNAVITPIGISPGATAVRASRSTRMRNEEPDTIDNGSTER